MDGGLTLDVQQDAAVAPHHDQQGADVQRAEMEHVVERLLPAARETAVSRTLREVHVLRLTHTEQKQLHTRNREDREDRRRDRGDNRDEE